MNLKQHKFVTEYLRFGDQAIAYKNAYNSNATGKVIESAANRLMKHPEVAQAIADAQATIREQVTKEVAEQLKGELLTIQHKRELLYRIATGEMRILQYHKGKDCNTCSQYVTPSINQMLRAIHLDNKLAGHYPLHNHSPLGRGVGVGPLAPEKQKHETTQQNTTISTSGETTSPVAVTVETKQKSHNTPIAIGTQQIHRKKTHPNPSAGGETGNKFPSGEGIGVCNTQERQLLPSLAQGRPGGATRETQDKPTITSEALNNLLNTTLSLEDTPRILQFRQKETLVE